MPVDISVFKAKNNMTHNLPVSVERVTGRSAPASSPEHDGSHTANTYNETASQKPCAASGVAEPAPFQDRSSTSDFGWVADLLRTLWPHLHRAAENQAQAVLPGALAESKPSFVQAMKLRRFELGTEAPVVTNIRVHRDESLIQEVFLEFDFQWKSHQDLEIELVVPQLPLAVAEVIPDVVEGAFHLLLTQVVAVKDLSLRGALRVTLRPLFDRLPVVGGVQLSLVRVPEVDYKLSLGVIPAALIPLLKSWIDSALKEMVFAPYVLPEHHWIPLDPEAQDVDKPAGALLVRVVAAENIPWASWFGSLNPYVEVYARSRGRYKTRRAKSTHCPHWDESFVLPVQVPEHQELTLIVFDHNEWTADDEIGRTEIPVRDLQPRRRQTLALPVSSKAEKTAAAEKEKAGTARTLLMTLGRPFTKQSRAVATLHVQVEYRPFTPAQLGMIQKGMQGGWEAVASLPEQQAAPLHLRSLLYGGTISLVLRRVEGLRPPRALLRTSTVKGVLQVGDAWDETESHRVSRKGAVEFFRTVTLHISADATLRRGAQVLVKLHERNEQPVAGSLAFPLVDVVERRRLEGEFELAGGDGARAHVELRWQGHLF